MGVSLEDLVYFDTFGSFSHVISKRGGTDSHTLSAYEPGYAQVKLQIHPSRFSEDSLHEETSI